VRRCLGVGTVERFMMAEDKEKAQKKVKGFIF
jgi:hypothetical protein